MKKIDNILLGFEICGSCNYQRARKKENIEKNVWKMDKKFVDWKINTEKIGKKDKKEKRMRKNILRMGNSLNSTNNDFNKQWFQHPGPFQQVLSTLPQNMWWSAVFHLKCSAVWFCTTSPVCRQKYCRYHLWNTSQSDFLSLTVCSGREESAFSLSC